MQEAHGRQHGSALVDLADKLGLITRAFKRSGPISS